MDTNVNYTIVGAFVILIVSSIVFAVIWLSSGFHVKLYKSYLIYSQESVSGLNVDAQVEYNGVAVGSVKDISLDSDNPHLVRVLLNIETSTPITRGTVATLASRGVTGVYFIALKDVGDDQEPLEILPGQEYPVIKTSPSLLVRLDTALTKLTTNIQVVSDAFKALLDKQNLQLITSTLNNLDKVTTSLAGNTQKLNAIMLNTSSAMKTLDLQTLPATYRMLSNMNDVMRNLNEISIQLKQNPSILIKGAAPLPLGPGEKR